MQSNAILKLHLEATIVAFYGMEREKESEKMEKRSNLLEHILSNEKKTNLSLGTHTLWYGAQCGFTRGKGVGGKGRRVGFYRQISAKQGLVGMGTTEPWACCKNIGEPVYISVTNTLPRVRNAKNNITIHNQTPCLGHNLWKCEGSIGLSIWILKKKNPIFP